MRYLVVMLMAFGLLTAASLASASSAFAQSTTTILDIFDGGP